jgi:hypothetical protein
MDHYAGLDLLKTPEIVSTARSETRTKIIRGLMIAAIAAIVVLAIIAQAHPMPEDGLTSFVNCCSRV